MTEREQVESARKKVLAVYPAAFAHQLIEGPWAIFISGNQEFGTIKKWSHAEDEAWIEFASRIDAPVEPKAQVESASIEEDPCKMTDAQYEAYIYGPDRAKWPTNESEMTNAELDAELRANGIDPHELNKKMLARIREEKAAGKSGPMMDAAERQFEAAVKEGECEKGLPPKRRAVLRPTRTQPKSLWQSYATELERDYADSQSQLKASLLREKGLRELLKECQGFVSPNRSPILSAKIKAAVTGE